MKQFNKNNFVQEWINQDEYYRIGYDKFSSQKIIAITITWICWYDIYFKLTNEEFEWHKTQIEKLNDLAQRMAVDKGSKFYNVWGRIFNIDKYNVWGRIFNVDKRSSTITVPHFVNIKDPFCSFYSI